jgi:hypothetical protein
MMGLSPCAKNLSVNNGGAQMDVRDGMQGAKSRARRVALPDFATPQTARKSVCPAGWGEIGRFAHQIPCMGVQPMLRNVGEQLIPIATQRAPPLLTDKF